MATSLTTNIIDVFAFKSPEPRKAGRTEYAWAGEIHGRGPTWYFNDELREVAKNLAETLRKYPSLQHVKANVPAYCLSFNSIGQLGISISKRGRRLLEWNEQGVFNDVFEREMRAIA